MTEPTNPERERPTPEQAEELVAYLDGELDETTAQQVEARLNTDPAARQESEALQAAWDLLDHLPRPEPSPDFTHRTLENVQVKADTARLQARRRAWTRWRPRLVAAGWAAAVLVAFLAGYVGFLALRPADPSDHDLARDLSLIENQRLYEFVDDLGFLRQLDTPALFGEEGGGQ